MNFELKIGEEIFADTPANLLRGIEAVGGRLKLTNKRILFEANTRNFQTMPAEIPLEHIIDVKKNKTYGLIPNGLMVCTKSLDYKFIVWGREKLINLIENQISHIRQVDSFETTNKYCSNCGKAYLSNENIKFCPECDNKY